MEPGLRMEPEGPQSPSGSGITTQTPQITEPSSRITTKLDRMEFWVKMSISEENQE